MCLLQGDDHLILIVVIVIVWLCSLSLVIVICFLSFVRCRVFNYLGRIIGFVQFGCGYFFVLLFHCCVIVFPCSLWPMVVIRCLSFLNFPVCDLSLREKLVLCGLAGRG